MAELEQDYEGGGSGNSGASLTFPQQCSALRKNGYVMIKGRPCKVVEMSTSKTGKHGHAKVHLVALDIFTGKKLEDICPSTHNVDVPHVKRNDYELMDITDDDFVALMDEAGHIREDLKMPLGDGSKDSLPDKLREEFQRVQDGKQEKHIVVTVQKALDEEAVISFKLTAN